MHVIGMVNKAPEIEILKRFLVNDSMKKELIAPYFKKTKEDTRAATTITK